MNESIGKLLTRRQVVDRLGLADKTGQKVRCLERRGLLPRVELSPRCIRYRASDVEKLINETLLVTLKPADEAAEGRQA
jgi:hypothetical protein